MIVKVTKNHIDRGKPDSCYNCPIALALHEADYAVSYMVTVSPVHVHLEFSGIETEMDLPLPQIACDFIDDFDNGRKVKPFEFELEIPSAE